MSAMGQRALALAVASPAGTTLRWWCRASSARGAMLQRVTSKKSTLTNAGGANGGAESDIAFRTASVHCMVRLFQGA